MRKTLLTVVAMMASVPAYAAIITEDGTPQYQTRSEGQASFGYSFAPIAVTGTVTAISLTYVGSVVPGISGFGYDQLISYKLTPYAQIQNTGAPVLGGYSSVYTDPNGPTAAGASVTVVNAQRTPITLGSPITVSTSIPLNSYNLTGLSTGPISFQVAGYTIPSDYVYAPNTIISVQPLQDASSVNAGRLTLAVIFDPATAVPEPMTLALLGVGMVGTLLTRRRA